MHRLAQEGVRRVYLDGGVAIRQGLDEDVIDDMTLSTVPITLGAGRRLFGGPSNTRRWTLSKMQRYASGLVQVRYERER
jgi:dihydrofolate reductase